jgi:hypothetical protein
MVHRAGKPRVVQGRDLQSVITMDDSSGLCRRVVAIMPSIVGPSRRRLLAIAPTAS